MAKTNTVQIPLTRLRCVEKYQREKWKQKQKQQQQDEAEEPKRKTNRLDFAQKLWEMNDV